MTLDAVVLVLLGLVVALVAIERLVRILRRVHGQDEGREGASPGLALTHQGVAFRTLRTPQHQKGPPTVQVTVPSASPETFTLVKEGAADRFSKRTGISTEIQTGDPAFDREVYIESDSPGFVRTLLGTAERRNAVLEVFRAGFEQIHHEGGELTATATQWFWEPERDVELATIQAVVLHLATLREGAAAAPTTASRASRSGSESSSSARIGTVVVVVAFGSWLYALIFFPAYDTEAVWHDSLKLTAVGVVAALVVGFVRFRRTSRRLRTFLFLCGVWLVALVLGPYGLTVLLNVWLDPSPLASHVARVESKRQGVSSKTGRAANSYYATVPSWRAPGHFEEVRVTAGDYQRIMPGTTSLLVRAGAGRFGYPYVAEIRLVSPGEALAMRKADVEARPRDDRAVHERGVAYLASGDRERAIDDFKRAVELNPRNADAYQDLGLTHVMRDEHREAVAAFTALIALKPSDPNAYQMRGWSRRKVDDREGALADLTRACQLGFAQACEQQRRLSIGR